MWRSAFLFVRGPVGLLAGLLSAAFTAVGLVQVARDESFWMWFCYAALAVAGLSFWRFHRDRTAAARSFPARIDGLMNEGLDVYTELDKPLKELFPDSHYPLAVEASRADRAFDFWGRGRELVRERPSLLPMFTDKVNSKRAERRKGFDSAEAEESPEDGTKRLVEAIHAQPAALVEATLDGLADVRNFVSRD